jgi:hypothetical protein
MIDYTGDQMKELDQYLSGVGAVMKDFYHFAWCSAGPGDARTLA